MIAWFCKWVPDFGSQNTVATPDRDTSKDENSAQGEAEKPAEMVADEFGGLSWGNDDADTWLFDLMDSI
jgi:hypothetical protein